MNTKYTENSL